ncbi:MAG: PD-(D/E)XK nuclease family protein [Chloroflexi bacterium]|jgi:putative RecB family exonuclease|nr:PD-(D/E)XK nuclease family protein [Chloroflexota bacterium]MBT7082011.1 PD-(D/E)XK nuclease family protein [Chloroflexota bacterium]MBT7289682.1 PD-(D/E)XK nuclease family protein [Chloroflexota bacterium]
MPVYSHSQLGTYEQCPLKYKLNYRDKIKRDTKGVEAYLGTIVHDTLQKCYDDAKQAKTDTLEDLFDFYSQHWQKNWNDSILIVRKEYTADDYFNRGKQMLTGYYNRYAPFDSDITIETEMFTTFEVGESKHKLRGFIDRLSRKGDIYQIHDYKTSSHLPSQAEADADRQLAMYQIGIRQKWPHIKNVELIWHYLAFDEDLISVRSEDSISNLRSDLVELIEQVENAVDFPPKESALCNWCEYPDLCPLRKHFHMVEPLPPEQFLSETGVSLVNKYAGLKEKESEIKREIEEIKESILSYVKQEGVEVVKGSDRKIKVKFNHKLKLPGKNDPGRADLDKIIQENGMWNEVSQLDISSLSKALQGRALDETLKNRIIELGTTEESSTIYLSKLKEQEK